MNPYFDTSQVAGLLILIVIPGLGSDGTQRGLPGPGRTEGCDHDWPAKPLGRHGGPTAPRHERRAVPRPASRPAGHEGRRAP